MAKRQQFSCALRTVTLSLKSTCGFRGLDLIFPVLYLSPGTNEEILSEKNEEPFFFDKKTRLSSNDSQQYLKIVSKNAGQPRRQHEHGAKIGLQQSCARVWPSLCSSLPWAIHLS